MQATLSYTASGEHHFSGLSSLPSHSVADGIGLAHDAGNLLGAIQLYCDLLALPGVLRSEHRHYAEELRLLTARSGSLIDRLLRPARPGSQAALASALELTERPTPVGEVAAGLAERVCPGDLVMECRGMLEPVAGAGSLLIAVEAGARGEIAVPREALERILLNLIKNAAEARSTDGQGSGPVAVRVRAVTGWGAGGVDAGVDAIAVSVEDRGRGMDEATLRAVLAGGADHALLNRQEAQRLGRGIGLRVVRELTARTGGELRMRSRIGQGTTVEIVWPVVGAAVPRDGAESG